MKRILLTRQINPIAYEMLSKHFHVEVNPHDSPLSPDALVEAVKTFDGILCTIPDRFTKEILEQATTLKALSNLAIGLDNIDVAAARERGIGVYNLPDLVTQSTADLTFALLLSFVRRIVEAKEYVLAGRWRGWEPGLLLGEELHGKTLGIIGFGRIGKAVAKRALGFGLKVITLHRSKVEFEEELQGKVHQVTFDELLHVADYISLHVPLTEETRGLINAKTIRKMGRRPLLLNMARGAVIDTDALVVALQEGLIRGAALDVTDPEPIEPHHPLLMCENCLIVPHIGSATEECRFLMARRAAENLLTSFGI